MKYNRVISTAVLALLLGTTLPAFAQKGQEQKGGGGGKAQTAQHQSQPQHTQQAQRQSQPQHTQQAQRQSQPQRTQRAQRQSQPQHTQQPQRQAQPQRTQQAQRQSQPQRTQQAQRRSSPQRKQQARQSGGRQQQTVAYNGGNNGNRGNGNNGFHGNGNNGNHYGRISDVSYRSNFGHDHSFHMGRPEMMGGYNRFRYGGYSFGFNEGWPIGWDYNDDCYVEYIDGAYYMFDLRHPGIRLTLNIF